TVARLGNFGEKRIDECGLAGRGSTCDEDIASPRDRATQYVCLVGRHDSGADVVVESENRDRGLADGEGRRRDDWWDQALESFTGFGQLSRDARGNRMPPRAHMMGNQANDTLAIGH